MGKQAFALREDRKESFSDAAVSIGGGRTLRVGERLQAGDGVIVTEDPREQEVLSGLGSLKEIPLSEVRAKSPDKLTIPQLREILDARGVKHSKAEKKDELLKLVKDSDDQAGSAGGEE